MSKRQQLLLNHNRTMKRSRLLPKKHLYLVLDDWDEGFSVHKIDLGTLQDTTTDLQVGFPEPAVLRLGAPELSLTTLGSNIFIATNPRCGQTPTLVYNTEKGGLTMGPRLPAPLLGCFHISVAAGDMLYGLSSYHLNVKQQHSFEVLSPAPTGDKQQTWSTKPSINWSWKSVPSPPPLDKDEIITSYALHPDGHTIVMSVHDRHALRLAKGTHSYDTKHCEWRWHGEWVLPFQGQGFFDSDLDAWVGLHEDGYICSCQVISCSSASTMQPKWKMSKDKFFCSESDRHLGATLTYMGDTRFCLVECVVDDEVEPECAFGDRNGCVLRLVTFGLKYSQKGELQTKIHHTTSTLVSKHLVSFAPVAFWM
ncbi:unnamed protein product [Alopecurus aequalis]